MLSDSLYASAFAVKKAKLWKKLFDNQLFAVRHFDSTISYCCVMGKARLEYVLAFFLGDSGLASLDHINREAEQVLPVHEQHELLCSQDCVSVSFVNKSDLRPRELAEISSYCKANGIQPRGAHAYPQFDRCRPHFMPWYIDDETEQRYMLEGMNAALEVARRLETETPEALGFKKGTPYEHSIPLLTAGKDGYIWDSIHPKPQPALHDPAAVLSDELALARIKQNKSVSGEWACLILLHNQPIVPGEEKLQEGEEPHSAPYFPYLMMIVSMEDGMVLGLIPAHDPEDYAPEFTAAMLEMMRKNGKPSALYVQDTRTYDFLLPLAQALSIRITQEENIDPLCDALDGYLNRFYASADNSPDENELELFMNALRNDEALRQMPQPLFEQVLTLVGKNIFPLDVCDAIRKEAQRRGMRVD